ncbi:hypothetical protein JTB14_036234 [Gonioctena quinquepunctata]|nr:hypothetical protein JTB14_036234 [Gonioctena quinquepunctata]
MNCQHTKLKDSQKRIYEDNTQANTTEEDVITAGPSGGSITVLNKPSAFEDDKEEGDNTRPNTIEIKRKHTWTVQSIEMVFSKLPAYKDREEDSEEEMDNIHQNHRNRRENTWSIQSVKTVFHERSAHSTKHYRNKT